ncbi:[acyl-carrier-protein] S-malonyltransferase [Alkalilimnicola ehrlichii]|uniref:Malonyl CoA-acyl carrier protein transacylase n=1 Tax=Alkalilimnicola ehrlichii TaxID=351052 RepID=A0A3E0WMZ5_9GAMM|nr:ACP S-malonyltransferase [Alkalilimnicola ehrlichii]RFA29969.1 [acyl-carrier-protein] S-malonyltransferase [Alkalilimnicola ehrlichii]RFA33789.1 [acyl-carrier-protein] S-malonyltransferase [Alkalilimnicola ehrlichii]
MVNKTLAYVFPGQGSQAVGMLAELAEAYDVVKRTFDEASDSLGYDLWNLVQQGPEADLNRTDRTQPAMLVAGVAVWRVLAEQGAPKPALLAGHSLGEYTALVCAEALAFGDAVALVADRGRFMQEAVPEGEGAMAAILGLDDDQVRAACDEAAQGEVVEPVNFNAPGQVVIAGAKAAVERAVDAAKAAGAKRALPLPVSVPSHCALMKPASERLAERLNNITVSAPTIPVVHNADVSKAGDADAVRERLVRQLYSPVRWVETIQGMASEGIEQVVECGPGKVLAGLNKRIVRGMAATPVFDPAGVDKVLADNEAK